MAAGLVFYYTRKAGADLKGAQERLELHLKYIEGVLSKHEWYVFAASYCCEVSRNGPLCAAFLHLWQLPYIRQERGF